MPVGQTRRYAVVRAPLEELKAIGHHLGGSITDVVLAAATGGPRELLRSREEELPPPGLRALVPVTRRDASDRLTLGYLLSFLFVDLPVGEPLAQARLRNIAAATRRRKSSDAARATSTMIEVAALAPPVVAHAALTQTCSPGGCSTWRSRTCRGRRCRCTRSERCCARSTRSCRCSPATRWESPRSFNGQVTFGINADASSMPDIDVLARGIAEDLEKLHALVPTATKVAGASH